jgi:hypothetical protein
MDEWIDGDPPLGWLNIEATAVIARTQRQIISVMRPLLSLSSLLFPLIFVSVLEKFSIPKIHATKSINIYNIK